MPQEGVHDGRLVGLDQAAVQGMHCRRMHAHVRVRGMDSYAMCVHRRLPAQDRLAAGEHREGEDSRIRPCLMEEVRAFSRL